MAVLISILRFVLPLIVVLIIGQFIMPRIRRTNQGPSDRVDVDATVISSEPHKINLDDFEPSEVYIKRDLSEASSAADAPREKDQ